MHHGTAMASRLLAGTVVLPMLLAAGTVHSASGTGAAYPAMPMLESVPRPVSEKFVASLSATRALAAMESGALTSEQYTDLLLDRIARYPELNAVIQVDPVQVRDEARRADATRAAGGAAPLLGLPILVKDSIDTAALPTTGGTPALAGEPAPDNAAVLQALLDAGAILLGKTNLHELSAGYTTTNPFTGATRNPYDLTRVPGGSSGGNGAALAARLGPVALGEDTAGSLRVPAALNGVMGFRPTSGRYSSDGLVPVSTTLDTIGPMARSVDDIALIDAVITGAPALIVNVPLGELRIGVPGLYFRDLLDPAVRAALERALNRMREAGIEIVEADLPLDPALTAQASLAISLFEVDDALENYLAERGLEVTLSDLAAQVVSPDVSALLALSLSDPVSEQEYGTIIAGVLPILESIYLQYLEANNLDAVIFPSNILPAPEIGEDPVIVDGVSLSVFDAYFRLGHFLPLVRAPALSLPIGQLPDGLPVGGIDLAGRPGDDRRILAIGKGLSRILPRVRPPERILPRALPTD